jgi:Ca-activated chloride channel family protein
MPRNTSNLNAARRSLGRAALGVLTLGLVALGLTSAGHAEPDVRDGNAAIQVDARQSHPVVLDGQRTTTYIKVGLTGAPIKKAKARAAVNVAIVLDRSGSMQGAKMVAAKAAARQAVDRLSDDDIVSVIAYDTGVEVVVPATKARDKESIRRGIDRLVPSGNTALFAGVSKGADELRKFLEAERVNRIVLLSDGLANVGPASPAELEVLGRRLGHQGISVTTLGLGLDYNEDLMARLARSSDGNHVFVERTEELARFFDLEFGELEAVVAQDVVVEINLAEGMRPVRVLGREADIVGQKVTARLNQVAAQREKFVLLEVEVAAGEAVSKAPMADIRIRYRDLASGEDATAVRTLTLDRTGNKDEVERRVDRAVMVEAVALIASERNQFAVVLRDQGKVEEARTVLQDNVKYLQKNSVQYKAPKLKGMSEINFEDANNLDEKQWNRQRKSMRREQNRTDLQQSY